MEQNIAVIEWSSDTVRAYNPVTATAVTAPTVSEAVSKSGIAGTVGLCLNSRATFVRETHVPAVEKSELRLIINVQLENLFPAIKSELAFDYKIGKHMFDDGLQTTVCAIQADVLRRVLAEVATCGLAVAWVAPTGMGAPALAMQNGHDDAIVVEKVGGFLNLEVVRHGMLVYSRAAVDPGTVEGRQGEVSRTLAAYGLPAAAVLAVNDVQLGDDVRQVESGLLQVMAAHSADEINIELPEAVATKLKKASQAKSRIALFMWLAVVAVGAMVYFDRTDSAAAADSVQGNLTRKVSGLEKDIDLYSQRLTTVGTDVESLDLAFKPAQPVTDVLTLVSNTLPSGAWLTGVTFERGKPLQVRGTALDGDQVSQYTAALAANTRFRDVQLVYANNGEIETVPIVQFAVTLHVVGNLPLVDPKSGGRRK